MAMLTGLAFVQQLNLKPSSSLRLPNYADNGLYCRTRDRASLRPVITQMTTLMPIYPITPPSELNIMDRRGSEPSSYRTLRQVKLVIISSQACDDHITRPPVARPQLARCKTRKLLLEKPSKVEPWS